MEANNDLPDIEIWEPIDSSQLSYGGETEVGELVRKAIDKDSASTKQHVCNEAPALKKILKPHSKGKDKTNDESISSSSESIINIQLPYDPDQAMELNTWDGNFYSVSLHRSIEHIVSNIQNIKESLHHMTKYILNKKVKKGKANNVKDLNGIDKAAWSFILSLYKVRWDKLSADSNNHSFRCKVKMQFNPQINKRDNSKKGKVLQLKDLRVGQWEEPCIGLTQENSIESSV